MLKDLRLEMLAQPSDTTCGPTCLQAVYAYYDDPVSLGDLIGEVQPLKTGGTLAVFLGLHALARGYRVTIYTYNLQVFDPTWFNGGVSDLPARLEAQVEAKHDAKLRLASQAYLKFLAAGGRLRHEELRSSLLRRFLKRGVPVLTGLSATYLYNCAREDEHNRYDDVRGEPTGHFVVLGGYNRLRREIRVADPLHNNPAFGEPYYDLGIDRVIGAILLGILTYDANLLIIEKPGRGPA